MLNRYREILRIAGYSQLTGDSDFDCEVWIDMEATITEVHIGINKDGRAYWQIESYMHETYSGSNPDSLADILGVTVK